MASAIHQLIAQQSGPDILGSMARGAQTAGMIQDVKSAPARMRLAELQTQQAQQQLDLGSKRLAQLEREAEQAKRQQGLKLAADAAVLIDRAQSPAQKAMIYEQVRRRAAMEGHDVAPWPEQYSDDILPMLEFAKQQVYGEKLMEHESRLREAEVKASGKAPTVRTFNLPDGTQVDREYRNGRWVDVGAPAPRWSDRKGLSITLPDGTVITQGASGELGSKAINDLQTKKFDSVDALSRLNEIRNSYDPEFLRLSTRWGAMVNAFKEKAGMELPEQDREQLQRFSEFKRAGLQNVNRTIKEITGAAMSVEEAKRITAELPNPGKGLTDGDSPTEFKSKLDAATVAAKRAIMRYNYALSQGMDPLKTGIELSDVDNLIDQRGAELEQVFRARNPGASMEEIQALVDKQLRQEFGVE